MNPIVLHPVNADTDRQAWLALRRRYLSATDWPKLTGSSRWGGPEEVLGSKLNLVEADGDGASLPMRIGKAMEPLIVAKVLAALGPGEVISQAFLSRGHLGFTPDLILARPGADWTLVEIKVSVKPWDGAVPEDYMDQVRFQATVLGIDEVQVVHLQLTSWSEGQGFLAAGEVPAQRLSRYRVAVPRVERRRIERQAEAWWQRHLGA